MNTSGPQTTAAHPSSAESNCLPLPCAFGAAEASDSIGGGEQKKNSNIYVSTESGEVHFYPTLPTILAPKASDVLRPNRMRWQVDSAPDLGIHRRD